MTELETELERENVADPIVDWQPRQGPLIGRWDAPVVAIATVSALALLGLTAGAYMAGRAQGRREYN